MEEKTVIITGANSGLGFECAKAVAAPGNIGQSLLLAEIEGKSWSLNSR